MSVDGVLARGRAAAEQLLRDTCTITRKTGTVLDQDTGQLTDTWETVYTGVCRLKSYAQFGSTEVQFGEREVALHRYEVSFPWSTSEVIERGDRLTVTASDDAWLIGRPLEVLAIEFSGTSTRRKILVENRDG